MRKENEINSGRTRDTLGPWMGLVSLEFDELIKSLTSMGMLHGLKKNRPFVGLNESGGNNSRYDETKG